MAETNVTTAPTAVSARPDDQSTWPLNLIVVFIFVFGVAYYLGTKSSVFGDGDVGWNIAAGQWMIEHGTIPYADPFSYTAFGKPWIAHEWLSEVLMALVFDAGSYTGLALLTATAVALTLLVIALRLQRWMRPVEMCTALMIIALALYPLTLARPLVLVWPMLALWMAELLRAREEQRLPGWWLIPLLAIWVNMHASFAVGLGLAAMIGFEALVESGDRGRTFVQWGLYGCALGLAACANPHGLSGALYPLGVFTSPTVNLISEFHATDFSVWVAFEVAVMAFIGIALFRGARLAPVRLAMVLFLLHLAFTHIRHQSIFVIVGSLVALPAFTTAWIAGQNPTAPLMDQFGERVGGKARAWLAMLALLVLVSGVRSLIPAAPTNDEVIGVDALDRIPRDLRTERVLNEYSFGGPLILRGIKVFMDGRTDVYGDAHFLRYLDIAHGDAKAFAAAQRQWHFCWTIFPPRSRELLALLDRTPGWQRVYADEYAVIHVRRPCGSYR